MELQRTGKIRTNLKLFAAVVGGSAVVMLAALGIAIGQEPGAAVAKSTSMSVGGTTTQTTPSTAPAIGMAKPTLKGPAPLPSEEEAAK